MVCYVKIIFIVLPSLEMMSERWKEGEGLDHGFEDVTKRPGEKYLQALNVKVGVPARK